MVKTVTESDYEGGDGDTAQVDFGSKGLILWDSPVGGDVIAGVYVEFQFGSQSTDLAYAPVLSWLQSQGAEDLVPVELVGRRRTRASGVRIVDPDRLLLGQTLAVSAPRSDNRTNRIETVQFLVQRQDYIELGWPVFTSALEIADPRIFMQSQWDRGVLQRTGTYVGAWVVESEVDGASGYVQVETWLSEPERRSPNNLYISELTYRIRIRDRLIRLVGKTLLVAYLAQ